MLLSRYLLIMTIATLLCLASWILVIININPFETGLLGFFAFYASLFLTLTGIFTLAGFALRVKVFKQDEPYFRQVKKTFRHGLLFSALLILVLILQSQHLLKWWNFIILILAFGFLEMFFLTKKPVTTNYE